MSRSPRIRGVARPAADIEGRVLAVLRRTKEPLGPQAITLEAYLPDTQSNRGRVHAALVDLVARGQAVKVGRAKYAIVPDVRVCDRC